MRFRGSALVLPSSVVTLMIQIYASGKGVFVLFSLCVKAALLFLKNGTHVWPVVNLGKAVVNKVNYPPLLFKNICQISTKSLMFSLISSPPVLLTDAPLLPPINLPYAVVTCFRSQHFPPWVAAASSALSRLDRVKRDCQALGWKKNLELSA